MSFVRRHLSWMLAGWIAAQLSLVAAPVVHAAARAVLTEAQCTCGDGAHDRCPMHHDEKSSGAGARCVLQSPGGPTDLLPVSLASGAGVMPTEIRIDPVPTVEGSFDNLVAHPIARADLPDPPPPRT